MCQKVLHLKNQKALGGHCFLSGFFGLICQEVNGVARFISVCVSSDFKGVNISMGRGHACLCIKDALEIKITDELIYISSS